jgi:hypothetical protein
VVLSVQRGIQFLPFCFDKLWSKDMCFYLQNQMPDYNKSKIFRVQCPVTNRTYIGSTCQALSMRFASLKRNSRESQFRANKKRSCLDELIPVMASGKATIHLIEDYPCANKTELAVRTNVLRQTQV